MASQQLQQQQQHPGQAFSELVDQLQTFESSFTTILFEIAMKMSSLTNTSVFLLVEGKTGRKFSGDPELCSAYVHGRLQPRISDVELTFDPNTTSVHEKHQQQQQQRFNARPTVTPRKRRSNEDGSPGSSSEKRSRYCKIESMDSFASSKSRCLGDDAAAGVAEGSWEAHARDVDDAGGTETRGDANDQRVFLETMSQEAPTGRMDAGSPFSGFSLDRGLGVDDGERCESPEVIEDPSYSTQSASSSVAASRFPFLDASTGALVPRSQSSTQASLTFADYQTDLSVSSSTIPHLEICPQKLQAVQSMTAEQVFFKGTIGNRVLMSVMYEFGRATAEHCKRQGLTSPKDPAARNVLNHVFEVWINENLPHLYNSTVKPDQIRTAQGFLKHIARMNFYCCFRKPDKNGPASSGADVVVSSSPLKALT